MTIPDDLRRTPLHEEHIRLGARMVPFAGWQMPVQYAGVMEEARAVRQAVGLFDISHMGRFRVAGSDAEALLQQTTTNDVSALSPGKAQYSLIPNEQGGILDDIIVYRKAPSDFIVVVNASNRDRDLEFFKAHAPSGTSVEDVSDATGMVAVQGPAAQDALQPLTDIELASLPRFGFAEGSVAGRQATICRTGYTGEDGFEVIGAAAHIVELWRALVDAHVVPCGLGARDSLRTEAGYPLYGHEIDETTTPVEAGLMWAVKLDKGSFVGRDAILAAKQAGPSRKLMGLIMEGRALPRQGYSIEAQGEPIGVVTSGAFSATRSIALGMGYVRSDHARNGATVDVVIRGTTHACRLLPKKDLLTATITS